MIYRLYSYQEKAVNQLRTGSILNGKVGSGKSLTALAYYWKQCGGDYHADSWKWMTNPKPLYIITTARKRDTFEWEGECTNAAIGLDNVHVDSWNNIGKYTTVRDAFFIFDEQRVVGYGAWTKAFLKITKNNNEWILLSATPGDCWSDYMPVFIANGFYKNKSDFQRQHVVYSRYTRYPRIDHYVDTGTLIKHRRDILVDMNYRHDIEKRDLDWSCDFDRLLYKDIIKNRWDPFKEQPVVDAGNLCGVLRKVVNSDPSRLVAVRTIVNGNDKCPPHPKVIIFYNFDYELDALEKLCQDEKWLYRQWNGHKHERIPSDESAWVYLVQYTAGAEGWNCILTDTIIFYSQNYSYKIMQQAAGRIDRLNTPFLELYYYHLKSKAPIDICISRALEQKRNFNESEYGNEILIRRT